MIISYSLHFSKAQKGYLSSALATILGFVPAKALASDAQVRKWKEMGENAMLAASPGLKKQLELQMKWLDDETSAEAE